MSSNENSDSIVNIITEAAHSLGANVYMEDEWRCVGNVVYSSGISRYFRLSTLDLNTMGASEVARDKGYARHFLFQKGYPIAKGKTFFTQEWAEKVGAVDRSVEGAWNYANQLGLPVYLKPNSLSRGVGVAKITSRAEFDEAVQIAMKHDRVFLIEEEITGRDYRLVVLDGEVISAYERLALSIVGDGFSTIDQLLDAKESDFVRRDRKTNISRTDSRLLANLNRQDFTLDSVIESGKKIKLLDNANLSSGGESIDVTGKVSNGFKALAARISFDMGLRLVGLDLMIQGDVSDEPGKDNYNIIEINSAPGLDHYASMGEVQRQIVSDLYRRVIRAMERPDEAVKMERV